MSNMEYKGYLGSVEYSDSDKCMYGRVIGMTEDFITYEGSDMESLEKDFHDAVDFYIENCKMRGVQPKRPYSDTISVHVSPDEHSRIAALARKSGQSVSSFIRNALALL